MRVRETEPRNELYHDVLNRVEYVLLQAEQDAKSRVVFCRLGVLFCRGLSQSITVELPGPFANGLPRGLCPWMLYSTYTS